MKTDTRLERKQAPVSKVVGFPERLSLFVTALHKQQTDELFVGLAAPLEKRAFAFAADMKQWDSARRQARLAHEFGVRPDAAERLKRLVLSVDGVLRGAVVASLPPAVRREFPQFQGGVESFPEAVRAVAARLVREASR
ncbi:MAG: hypothetical protein JNM17_20715 [Archangium sp.]|nr:hypothetical protein [Archangium sp.]